MEGVDQLDHNISKLRIDIRMKKGWWPFFAGLVNLSVQNASLLYRSIAEEQRLDRGDRLAFTHRIALSCLARAQLKYRGRPSNRLSRAGAVLPAIRFDRLDHLVVFTTKQILYVCAVPQKSQANVLEMPSGTARGLICAISQALSYVLSSRLVLLCF